MIRSRVKELMKERGVSIRKLMETTGLSNDTINRARNIQIKNCTLETLETIARALEVRIKDLFEEAEEGQGLAEREDIP